MNASASNREEYFELAGYTLAHGDPAFIHQHIVDAWAAQTAGEKTKPITLSFALVGLYLFVEQGWTGRQVQLAHMRMARGRRQWPRFSQPQDRGEITVSDVVQAAPGPDRDEAIGRWCASVWRAYGQVHGQVKELWQELQGS